MAITFISQNKRKKHILIFGIIILLIFSIVWFWFLKPKPFEIEEQQQWEQWAVQEPELLFPEFKKIEINFEVLKHPIFQILEDLPGFVFSEDIPEDLQRVVLEEMDLEDLPKFILPEDIPKDILEDTILENLPKIILPEDIGREEPFRPFVVEIEQQEDNQLEI